MIEFSNYTGRWTKDEDKRPTLDNINLKIKDKSLNAIIGSIGCGKSSLFMSLLKEIPFYEGKLDIKSSIAYVEQEPIVFSGRIVELVRFGCKFKEDKFDKIINATGLSVDIESFHDGV